MCQWPLLRNIGKNSRVSPDPVKMEKDEDDQAKAIYQLYARTEINNSLNEYSKKY